MVRPHRLLAAVSALAFAALIVLSPRAATAKPEGINGYSGKQNGLICNECHNGGTAPTVVLTGPDKLIAGQVANYVLTVTTNAARVGMSAAATDGTKLAPSTNTKALNAEVVHMQPTAPTNGAVAFTFKVTAPTAAGAITLWAAGNATNNSNTPAGDLAAATTKIVAVEAPPTPIAAADSGAAPPGTNGSADGGVPASTTASSLPGAVPTSGDGGTKPFSAGNDEPFDPTFAETGLSCAVGRSPNTPIEPGTLAFIGLALVAVGARWGRRRGEEDR